MDATKTYSRILPLYFDYELIVSLEISYVTIHSEMVHCTLMIINKDIFCSKSIVYIIIILVTL